MNKAKAEYTYDVETGKAIYTIKYNGLDFCGEAFCHPEDMDYGSERAGLSIAECRANIKLLRFMRDYEMRPQLKILKHLLHNTRNSKYYNPISHEAKMLRSQIRTIEKELATISNAIADEQKFIKDYIDGKDKMYKRLRAKSQ
jgi:hypothetical protein